jgi:serralysin
MLKLGLGASHKIDLWTSLDSEERLTTSGRLDLASGLVAQDSAASDARAGDGSTPEWMNSVNGRIGGTGPTPLHGGPDDASAAGLTSRLPQFSSGGHFFFTGTQDVDAVLIGSKWGNNAPGTANSITFSFPTSASFYGSAASYYDPDFINTFSAFTAQQQTAARYAFNLITSYTNLTITEITETASVHANVRLAQNNDDIDNPSAQGNFPGSDPWDGDIWFGQTSQPFYLTPAPGNWGQATVMHEIGHTMGLKHGHQDYTSYDLVPSGYIDGPGPRFGTQAITAAHDGQAWSLMTYRSDPANSVNFQGDGFNQPQTYMQLDIAALQYMYGADFGFNSGNTTYTFNPATGEMSINGVGQGAPTGNVILRTIWDGNGVDTYDFSNYSGNQTIDLTPGAFSLFSSGQRANHRAYSGGTAFAPGNIANALLSNGDIRSMIENANGGSGNDLITGNGVNNVLTGNAGSDTLQGGSLNDLLSGGAGNDRLEGGFDADTLNGGLDNDVLYAMSLADPTGSGVGDHLNGDDGNDTIVGSSGADSLDGGSGTDSMFGGDGNDVISQSFGGPTETMDGGAGTDTGDWSYSAASWTIDLNAGTANIGATTFANLISIENVLGASGNDSIDGNSGANSLNGGDGDDLLDGQGGYNDTMNGGNGIDTVDYSWIGSGFDAFLITIDLAAGTYTDTTGGETLISIENALGTQSADTIIGNGSANVLTGNDGNDTIKGGDGTDTMLGGNGDDVISQDFGGPNELMDGGSGNDTGDWSYATTDNWTISLAAGTAKIGGTTFAALTSIENVVGGQLADVIVGDTLANRLDGQAENDTISAGDGIDSLLGGDGDDLLNQGAGSGESMDGGNGVDTGDWSFSSSNWNIDLTALTAMVGPTLMATLASIENVIAGSGNDVITGAGGANRLEGQDGNDTINDGASGDTVLGGNGDDRFLVGDSIVTGDTWDGGAGFDTWDVSAYSFVPGVVIDLSTSQWTFNSFFETILNVEGVTGSQGGETIIGSAVGNNLDGQGGNDTMSGGDGSDTLNGGIGNDSLDGGNFGDTLRGLTGADTLDGGQGADSLNGGDGNDTILGNVGPDSMVGGAGVDTLDYSALAGETFLDLSNTAAQNTHSGGSDTQIGFENVTTGGGDDRIFGNGQANRLNTSGGADTINSGGGNDTVLAGAGDDYAQGGGGDDYIFGSGGRDRLLGGTGLDVFDFNASSESGLGLVLSDLIKDFSTAEGDQIDLADVYGGTLAYIGSAGFGGTGPGEVRVGNVAGGHLVQVDVNGDGVTDMDIYVRGSGLTGAAADFVL